MTEHPPCNELIILREKVTSLEQWRLEAQRDIKEIRDVISQVKLLISLSIGGGLSILTLIVTILRTIR